jgi:hypothetical protein
MASPAATVQEKTTRNRVRPDDRLEGPVAGLDRRYGERIAGDLGLLVPGLLCEA